MGDFKEEIAGSIADRERQGMTREAANKEGLRVYKDWIERYLNEP